MATTLECSVVSFYRKISTLIMMVEIIITLITTTMLATYSGQWLSNCALETASGTGDHGANVSATNHSLFLFALSSFSFISTFAKNTADIRAPTSS